MRYTVNRDNAYWRVLDGEAVIISAETSHYYSLNRTGTFVWSLLADHALTLEEVAARVVERYSRPIVDVSGDVEQIFEQLRAENLITASHADA